MGNLFKKLFKKKSSAPVIEKLNRSLTVELKDGKIIEVGNAQNQGARAYQEDSCGFSALTAEAIEQKGVLAVLADGMGGLENGKAVSEKTVSEILDWFNNSDECRNGESLKKFAERLNQRICSEFCPDGRIVSGSTLVCALIRGNFLHWVCIGDSRLYLKRGARMYQVNEDHDYLNQLLGNVMDKEMTMEEALSEPQKDSLVGCIGKSDLASFDYSKKGLRLEDGDKIVLCSDGIYNSISTDEFNVCLENDPQSAAEKIANAVLDARVPHQDNLTVAVIGFGKRPMEIGATIEIQKK